MKIVLLSRGFFKMGRELVAHHLRQMGYQVHYWDEDENPPHSNTLRLNEAIREIQDYDVVVIMAGAGCDSAMLAGVARMNDKPIVELNEGRPIFDAFPSLTFRVESMDQLSRTLESLKVGRRRNPTMPKRKNQGDPSDERMVTDTLKVGNRIYEQRMNRCGKTNCSACNLATRKPGERLGHGPYWYLCVTLNRRWRRIYIGKVPNTQLYIAPEGGVDWAGIKAMKADRIARKAAEMGKGNKHG